MKQRAALWMAFAAAAGTAARLAAWALRRTRAPAEPAAWPAQDRRSGGDRRSGRDRRSQDGGEASVANRIEGAADRRSGAERRSGADRRAAA